jgi:hypothetical protein
MATAILEAPRCTHAPEKRGYHAVYRRDSVNHCPGCGGSHWLVGRVSAQCAFCGTAIMLAEAGMTGGGRVRVPAFEEAA